LQQAIQLIALCTQVHLLVNYPPVLCTITNLMLIIVHGFVDWWDG